MAGLTAHPEVPFKESENAQSVEFYPWSLTVCDAEVNVYSEKVFPGFSLIEVTGWIPLQSGKQWLLCSLCWIDHWAREGVRKSILSSPRFVFLPSVTFSSLPHVWRLFNHMAAGVWEKIRWISQCQCLRDIKNGIIWLLNIHHVSVRPNNILS